MENYEKIFQAFIDSLGQSKGTQFKGYGGDYDGDVSATNMKPADVNDDREDEYDRYLRDMILLLSSGSDDNHCIPAQLLIEMRHTMDRIVSDINTITDVLTNGISDSIIDIEECEEKSKKRLKKIDRTNYDIMRTLTEILDRLTSVEYLISLNGVSKSVFESIEKIIGDNLDARIEILSDEFEKRIKELSNDNNSISADDSIN